MSEFKPITTKEEWEEAVSELLEREKKTVREEYEGYLSPEDVQRKYEGYMSPEDVQKKDATIKKYETNFMKMKIANKVGLPFEVAERLSGEDEAAIEKDAETLYALMGMKGRKTMPLRDTEADEKNTTDAALREMLSEMKGE